MSDITRKLATVRTIAAVLPIEGADQIELVKIDGWQCVVKKGEFKVGDPCVYFEIDSLLPIQDRYEFLRKSSYRKQVDGTEGFRLRTIKLRGQLSQGLALPLGGLGLTQGAYGSSHTYVDIGEDVTELLGVTKYEAQVPTCLKGDAVGMFPSFIRKTDEERIQNLSHFFTLHKDTEFEATIKLDGSSCTFYYKDGEFGVCSRNINLKENEGNAFWEAAKKLNLPERMKAYGRNIAIQGELVGEGIQKNPEGLKSKEFFAFNIWEIDEQRYMIPAERQVVLAQLSRLPGPFITQVPLLSSRVRIFVEMPNIDKLLEYVDGPSLNAPVREGVVFKSLGLVDGQLVSFKCINNKYLLKEKD